jgi:hypothetical protein
MTLQDDIARHWFQPSVPTDGPVDAPPQERVRQVAPKTTRIAGELPLDEAGAPLPPNPVPGPSRVEVTQPYIPAIRDQTPDFVKRLNPGPSNQPPGPAPAASPGQVTQPQPVTRPPEPTVQRPVPAAPPAPPAVAPKRRSLARRVIRRIIGPDLLRKDPPKQKPRKP